MTKENIDCCESQEIHQELLDIVREKMPPEEQLCLCFLRPRSACAIWRRH